MFSAQLESEYTHLKHIIKRFPLLNVFSVMREMNLFQTFNVKMSDNVPIASQFRYLNGTRVDTWHAMCVFPWEMEILLREYLKVFTPNSNMNDSLSKPHRFTHIFNSIKSLSDNIYKEKKFEGIEGTFWRISMQQFHWQFVNYMDMFTRYHRIFDNEALNSQLKDISPSFDPKKLILLGATLLGHYLKHFGLVKNAINIQLNHITKADFDFLASAISITIPKLRDEYPLLDHLSQDWEFDFNPLNKYPLILHDNIYYAPLPSLIVRRVTVGLRYFLHDQITDSKKRGDIQNAFGRSFEMYCYDVANILKINDFCVLQEEKFLVAGKEKRTQDLIIESSEHTVFVECKVRKLNNFSNASTDESYDAALKVLVSILFEGYTALQFYKTGKYPKTPYSPEKQKRLLVVLLDELYIIPYLNKEVFMGMIRDTLIKSGIDKDIIDEIPWEVCSAETYEQLIQHWSKFGIRETDRVHISSEAYPALKLDGCTNEPLSKVLGYSTDVLNQIYASITENSLDK